MIADWRALLESALSEEELRDLHGHSRTGRPLGDETFVERLECTVGCALKPQKTWPQAKTRELSIVSPEFAKRTDFPNGK